MLGFSHKFSLSLVLGILLSVAASSVSATGQTASENSSENGFKLPSLNHFQLSKSEQAWLESHPKIRVGTMNAWPPMDFVNDQGQAKGIGARFIEAINLRLNNALEIVPGAWKDIYADVKEKRLDALMGITPRPDREEFFHFTKPYITVPHAIFARNDSAYLNDIADLNRKRVGVERGFFIVKVLHERYPEVIVREYDSTSDALDAVAKGEVDAYIGNRAVATYIIETELISNIQQYGKITETSSVNAIGVRKDWPIFRDILQKALNSLTIDEMRAIMREWVDIPKSSYVLLLTESEQQWFDSKSEIRIGAMDAWPPFNFVDSDRKSPAGIGSDIVKALNLRLDNKLKIVSGPWKEIYGQVEGRELDAIMDITPKPAREEFFNFTKPYLDVPHVIVAPSSATHIANEDGLVGKVLALEMGFGNVKYFNKNYPDVLIKEYRDTAHAMGAVVRGEADAYAGNRGVALYLIEKELMTNLKIHGRLRKDGSILALGTRKDWPILRDILQKALDDITHLEYRKILSQWVAPERGGGNTVNLSLRENQWLKAHPVIQMAFDENYPPYSFRNEQGKIVGIAVDFAQEVAKRVGVRIDTYPDGEWKKLYAAAQKREVDVIATLVKREERKQWFEFTRPYISLAQYIITRKEDMQRLNKPEHLSGRTVALVEGYSMTKVILEEIEDIEPYYVNNLTEALEAVSTGKADATIGAIGMSHHLITRAGLTNLGFSVLYSKGQSEQRFGVRKDWPELAKILDKALRSISDKEALNIFEHWTRPEVAAAEAALFDVIVELTDEERAWLADNPVIRTASDPNWAPIEYVDEEGIFQGISIDYLKKLESLLGIKFEQVSGESWQEMRESFDRGEIDIFSSINHTPERDKKINFSDSYTNFPIAIFSGPEVAYIGGLKELKGKRVGVVEGYAAQEKLATDYPDIWLVPVSSPVDALEQLSRGEVDAYVGNILVTSYYIGKLGYTHLKVVGETPYQYEQSIGVRKDWPILISILNKALDAISEADKNIIYNRWVGVRYEHGFDYGLLWKVLVVVLILFALFTYWNRKLSNLNQQLVIARNQEEQARITVEEANEQLKTVDKLKSMFIASMSHELRTPLNSIIGFSGLMLQGVSGTLNEKQQDSMLRINRAGNHLLGLISDVIDISKIEAGRIDAYPEKLSLKEVVDDAVESIRPLADAKGLILTVSANSWPEITTDRKRLMQCLLNYLSNAVKFSEQGEVALSVVVTGERVDISVADAGIGISEEDLPKLFEAFERLESHLRVKAGGTGLGLYLTKKIAEEILHGSVSAESRIDEGSTFRLEFPFNSVN